MQKEKSIYFGLAEDLFKKIENTFPKLRMNFDYSDEYCEIVLTIPEQEGLDFGIELNLQNEDELHLVTQFIWCQFFSAENQEVVNKFFDAVLGLINSEYRIVQYVNKEIVYKTQLQKPVINDWETVYTGYERIRWPWVKISKNIIQNYKNSHFIKVY